MLKKLILSLLILSLFRCENRENSRSSLQGDRDSFLDLAWASRDIIRQHQKPLVTLYEFYSFNTTQPEVRLDNPIVDWRSEKGNLLPYNSKTRPIYRMYQGDPFNSGFVHFVNSENHLNKPIIRIYMNPHPQIAENLFADIVENFLKQPSYSIITAKIASRAELGLRRDAIVVYFHSTDHVPSFISHFHKKYPQGFINEIPATTNKLFEGVSWAPDGFSGGKSYGEILTTSVHSALMDFPSTYEEFTTTVGDKMFKVTSKTQLGCLFRFPF